MKNNKIKFLEKTFLLSLIASIAALLSTMKVALSSSYLLSVLSFTLDTTATASKEPSEVPYNLLRVGISLFFIITSIIALVILKRKKYDHMKTVDSKMNKLKKKLSKQDKQTPNLKKTISYMLSLKILFKDTEKAIMQAYFTYDSNILKDVRNNTVDTSTELNSIYEEKKLSSNAKLEAITKCLQSFIDVNSQLIDDFKAVNK